ncbi:hypothetical protein [Streptomyces sp. WAC01526]|uniref:hypothetical protein n=1 Tax=Streptomyces sp. WAC01526 TaxID=2588709 RepID=UPI0011DF6905|nr:hypothetical protein [Streptomyces sp. WAC01526]
MTGGPGSGKSALLGVVVCAAHLHLRSATHHLWRHIVTRPSANDRLVAVHARQRGVRDLTASLGSPQDRPGAVPSPGRRA